MNSKDDYIKRSDIWALARSWYATSTDWEQRLYRRIGQDIKAIPAAEVVEVRHGEWAWDNRCGLYTCSECGALSPRENQDGEYIDCPAYCHECGAKMDGGDHDA